MSQQPVSNLQTDPLRAAVAAAAQKPARNQNYSANIRDNRDIAHDSSDRINIDGVSRASVANDANAPPIRDASAYNPIQASENAPVNFAGVDNAVHTHRSSAKLINQALASSTQPNPVDQAPNQPQDRLKLFTASAPPQPTEDAIAPPKARDAVNPNVNSALDLAPNPNKPLDPANRPDQ